MLYEVITLLYSLISMIFKQIDKPIDQEKTTEYFIGNRIKKYIDDNYFEELTLDNIGSKLHISPSYLCNVFKKTTGYPPIQYIMNRRIGKAQSLLIGTDYSITEIAYMVGYADSNYFSSIRITSYNVCYTKLLRKKRGRNRSCFNCNS